MDTSSSSGFSTCSNCLAELESLPVLATIDSRSPSSCPWLALLTVWLRLGITFDVVLLFEMQLWDEVFWGGVGTVGEVALAFCLNGSVLHAFVYWFFECDRRFCAGCVGVFFPTELLSELPPAGWVKLGCTFSDPFRVFCIRMNWCEWICWWKQKESVSSIAILPGINTLALAYNKVWYFDPVKVHSGCSRFDGQGN